THGRPRRGVGGDKRVPCVSPPVGLLPGVLVGVLVGLLLFFLKTYRSPTCRSSDLSVLRPVGKRYLGANWENARFRRSRRPAGSGTSASGVSAGRAEVPDPVPRRSVARESPRGGRRREIGRAHV